MRGKGWNKEEETQCKVNSRKGEKYTISAVVQNALYPVYHVALDLSRSLPRNALGPCKKNLTRVCSTELPCCGPFQFLDPSTLLYSFRHRHGAHGYVRAGVVCLPAGGGITGGGVDRGDHSHRATTSPCTLAFMKYALHALTRSNKRPLCFRL